MKMIAGMSLSNVQIEKKSIGLHLYYKSIGCFLNKPGHKETEI